MSLQHDEPQEPSYPATNQGNPYVMPPSYPAMVAPPVRRKRGLYWGLGIAGVLVLCCAASSVFLFTTGLSLFQSLGTDNAATKAVLDQFMQAGANQDPVTAYDLFSSSSSSNSVSRSSLETLFAEHRDYFDGYQSVQSQNFRVTQATSGTFAQMSGTLAYKNHAAIPFNAAFVQEKGQWKLDTVQFSTQVGLLRAKRS